MLPMVWLIVTCWDGWSVTNGLLGMYLLCDVLWACKDVIESIYKTVKRRGVRVFEDFSIYFLGAFIIELLIFGDSFFDLFGCTFCCDFASVVFSFFGYIG